MTSTAVANNATGLTEAKKKSIQIKLFFRVWWLMFCTSYTKQQGTSTVWQLEPFLADIYGKDTDEYYDALQRHQNFFNTTPMFASFIYAIVISMEYERKAALDAGKDFDDASIEAIKVALMGPIAGIGDSIQLSCLRVIATGVAIGFSQQGSWLGPILFALIYNIPNQIIHWFCGSLGMKLGTGFITEAMASGKMQAFTKGFTVLGMIMVGAMTAQFVTVKTTLVIPTGGATFDLQAMFDSILPGFVPLAVTMSCFFCLRKSKSKNSAMILLGIILACCVVCTLLGITGGAA